MSRQADFRQLPFIAQGCLLIREGLLTATALQNEAEINADNVDEYIQIYIDNGELSEDALG